MTTATIDRPAGQRAIALRMRADLEYRSLGRAGRRFWRIKDPIAQRHFELRDEEFFILQQLNGRTSVEQICDQCAQRFAPRQLKPAQLMAFVGRLHAAGLVVADGSGQAEELLRRRAERRRQAWLWGWTKLLGLRWRGIDPEPLLRELDPLFGWIFSRWAVTTALVVMAAALALIAVEFDAVEARLPDFQAFFSLANAPWLALAVIVGKVLHELGHALACKRFGGECHELGIMMLVFLPCLYCDVSDAWMLPSRRQRAAIGSAGIYVELILAAAGTFAWWFSEPGWLNSICFNLMVVGSVNTLLLNGNPLLRYDGYFILSDLLEVPNLHERAAAALRRGVLGWFQAVAPPRGQLLDETHSRWLAAYAVASTVYRWLASAGVLWFCYQALKPLHLQVLIQGLTALMLAALIVVPLRQAGAFFSVPLWSSKLHWPRVVLAIFLSVIVLATILAVPVPHRVHMPVVIEPAGARRIYVTAPGRLIESAQLADEIVAGQTVAQLTDIEMKLEIARLQGQCDQQRLKIAHLKRQQVDAPRAGSEIPTAEEALVDLERRLEQRQSDQQRLTLVAPIAGTVLPAPRQASDVARGQLPTWSGSPLDPENRGCFLKTGTVVCSIGDPQRWEAVLVVDEDQLEFVRVGQAVQLLIDQAPESLFEGSIAEIAEIDLREAPAELVEHQLLPTRPDRAGSRRPVRTYYQARVRLDHDSNQLLVGATGQAKIYADRVSLGRRLWRFLAGTFRFEL